MIALLNLINNDSGGKQRYHRFFLWIIWLSLPMTAFLLWIIAASAHLAPHPDIPGLTASSVGILGFLVFFIFVYKYQIYITVIDRKRWVLLGIHALTIFIQFIILIWLSFASPWHSLLLWGSYSLEHTGRVWVIAVIVLGTITLLGSLFDAIRHMEQSQSKDGEIEVPQERKD